MRRPGSLLLLLVLAGCATESGDDYIARLVAECNAAGYTEASGVDRHIACVKHLHAQAQQQAEADRQDLLRNQRRRPQPVETHCRPDGLGGYRCTSR